MKKLIVIILLLLNYYVYGQVVDTSQLSLKLDLLKAPVSPASNLLGFAVSDIDKPTDVSDFMVSLQSATGAFTKLPTNYAIDIAPFLLFSKDTGKSRKLNSGNNIRQNLVLSFAYKNPDSTETTLNKTNAYAGFGFKVSILKGHYDKNTIRGFNKIQHVKLKAIQDEVLNDMSKLQEEMDRDPELVAMEEKRRRMFLDADGKALAVDKKLAVMQTLEYKKIDVAINEAYLKLATELAQDKYDDTLKKVASTFQVERIGWSLDLAGGISAEFVNKNFDNSRVHNAGLWISGGYAGKTGVSILGLARFLHNPDQVVPKDSVTELANNTNWDAGARLIYSKPQSKFSASLECISRWSSAAAVGQTWRLVFNADYALWDNQKLTFSFGRNYDGTIAKDGNLVAALSFLTGFGNRRK
ncbi:MAG TPA: hypothetical protein PLY34_18235 [Ferruginibacter sp.]|mgnify:FL=1|nr:hypothetical protein [Ferruginibacter sp.]